MSGQSGEKTEQPTPKRLRDARKKGQIAKSKEIVSAAIMTGAFTIIWLAWPFYFRNFKELIKIPSLYYNLPFQEALVMVINAVCYKFVLLSIPIIGMTVVVAILSHILQFGVIFSLDPIIPNLNKVNPVEGFKKIFSLSNLIELLKSMIKIIFLGVMIYYIVKGSISTLIKIPIVGISAVLTVLGAILFKIAIYTVFAFITIAILDHFFQKYLHIRRNKMTKDEVKREFKEMEGDPVIKSKRKALHQELAMSDMLQSVKKANVIVTNPTHIAVALQYEKGETDLPVVLAKGQDSIAKQIIQIARKERIPIMQNIPLARNLYNDVDLNQFIPSDLIKPVAEVLKWVKALGNKKQEWY